METRAHFVLIGAFVMAALAAAALFAVWISGSQFSRNYETYDVLFVGAVNGLGQGGEVRFNGIKVGEVVKLSLDPNDPNNVVARVHLDPQTPVREDSIATLQFQGITGVTFIQLRAGSPNKPFMRRGPNGQPPVIRTERTALDELFQGGQDLVVQASETMRQINRTLGDENQARVAHILENIDKLTTQLADEKGVVPAAKRAFASVDKAAISIEAAARDLDSAVRTLNRDLPKITSDASELVARGGKMAGQAQIALENLNGVLTQANTDLAPAATRAVERFAVAAGDLQGLIGRLQALAIDVEQDPSRFVYQRPIPVEKKR